MFNIKTIRSLNKAYERVMPVFQLFYVFRRLTRSRGNNLVVTRSTGRAVSTDWGRRETHV